MFVHVKYKQCFLTLLSLLLLSVSAVVSVSASEQESPMITFPDGRWNQSLLKKIEVGPSVLSKDEIFEVALPPANDSDTTRKELEMIRAFVKNERTEDNIARIKYEHDGGSAHDFFLKEGLIDSDNYKTIDLLSMIDADQTYFILERKKHFARPRPNQLDPEIELILPNPGHAAYPSGHASQTYMVALVLSDFDPDNADKYKQFAIDVAHRREIAGFHYPSDSEAGRKLAVDILARLRDVPVFEKKFQDAKESYIKPDMTH